MHHSHHVPAKVHQRGLSLGDFRTKKPAASVGAEGEPLMAVGVKPGVDVNADENADKCLVRATPEIILVSLLRISMSTVPK